MQKTVYSGLDLASETQNGEVIIREPDEFGRPHTLSLSVYGFPYYASENRYDPLSGRLSAVQTYAYNGSLENPLYADQRFDYAYLPGSDLPQSVAGAVWDEAGTQWAPALTTVRAYEAGRDLVSAVSNAWGAAQTPVRTYAYQNDAAGRRFARLDFDGAQVAAANLFGYNTRSEVTSALMGTHNYSYAYDPMGNRVSSEADGEEATYAANALNQYACITNSAFSASPRETVPVYDLDGNMTAYGPWTYTWDAENRMASAVANGVLLVTNVYDHLNRRIRKSVYATSDLGSPISDIRFLYDGWNVLREKVAVGSGSTQSEVVKYYTWGLDLSGTAQGAGGVGGLLAMTSVSSDTSYLLPLTYYPSYDANGNVTAYLDANGATAGAFEYDAFGNTISEAVSPGLHLPHRFSTKYLDPETGMYYYGFRFYHPELGRWVSRDPIGEEGGVNVYSFCKNNGIRFVDPVGNEVFYFSYRDTVNKRPTEKGACTKVTILVDENDVCSCAKNGVITVKIELKDLGVVDDEAYDMFNNSAPIIVLDGNALFGNPFLSAKPYMRSEFSINLEQCPFYGTGTRRIEIGDGKSMGAVFELSWRYSCKTDKGPKEDCGPGMPFESRVKFVEAYPTE